MKSQKKQVAGFHLIEILSTLAIIGILTTLCMPLYSQYTVQTRRLEAVTMLSRLAVALEEYRINHNGYRDASLTELHFPEMIAKGNYQLAIQQATDNEYQLMAIPQGKQAERDPGCAALTLHSNAEKGITGSGKIESCW